MIDALPPEPPALVQLQTATEDPAALGRMVAYTGYCGFLGYDVSTDDSQAALVAFTRRTQAEGTFANLNAVYSDALIETMLRLKRLTLTLPGETEAEANARAEAFARQVAQGCAEASRNFPKAFRADGDEQLTAEKVAQLRAEFFSAW